MNKLLSICTILFFFISAVTCAQGFDTVQIKTIKITDKIYMLEGAGGNIGVIIGNDGTVIIDDQFDQLTEKIKQALKALSDKPLRFVINTHFHADHTGGNEKFGGEGSIIVAQENSRRRMTTDQLMNQQTVKAAPYNALPKITFKESMNMHLNGETVEIVHAENAHTDGDAIIYFKESNVVHAGDVFVRYGLPFIDQPHGGSINGMINAMDQLLTLVNDETKIIPGHGALANKKDLVEYRDMLVTVRDRILKLIREGKTYTQVVESDPTSGFKPAFDKKDWIKAAFDSLKD